MATNEAAVGAVPGGRDTRFFGHPAGLSTLFFTEMWERFSYYGMRALLVLFMTTAVSAGGLGWDAAKSGPIYGLYTSMVYLACVPGGWVSDRILGQRRSVFAGGVLIALGHVCLTFHGLSTFYLGLFLIVLGTGLLKPNISTMVGALYTSEDERRDAGFSLFYMGINFGALFAPIVCAWLAQSARFKEILTGWGIDPANSWHWGFGAAAVGMSLGLLQYVLGRRRLGSVGLPPDRSADRVAHGRDLRWLVIGVAAILGLVALAFALQPNVSTVATYANNFLLAVPVFYFAYLFSRPGWTAEERKHLYAIAILFVFASLFWSAFEQAGSTLNLFALRNTANTVFGWEYPSGWMQSVNSAWVFSLAPVFAWIWLRLGKRQPSSPTKFALGLLFVGLGYLLLSFAAQLSGPQGIRVSPMWLVTVYLLHTIGELCLSPVGLSAMTKLAPGQIAGQVMGIWFLATSLGNSIGGRVSGLFDQLPLPRLFFVVFAVCMAFTVLAVILIQPLKRLMGKVN
jgi:POT family proton-dependent oligopeptide transporter